MSTTAPHPTDCRTKRTRMGWSRSLIALAVPFLAVISPTPTSASAQATNRKGGSWSPDGTQIAFASNRTGEFQIYRMNVDGTGLRQLTHGAGSNRWPKWSPDGRYLLFMSRRDGDWEVYRVEADGSGERRVTNRPGVDEALGWFDDGNRLITMGISENADTVRVLAYDPEGRGVVEHARCACPGFFHPTPSPDGEWLVFWGQATIGPSVQVTAIMRRDGTGIRVVGEGTRPSWAPDGTQLVAKRKTTDGYVFDIIRVRDGARLRTLEASPTFDSEAAWSPDGSRILFNASTDSGVDLFIIAVDGATPATRLSGG